MTLVPLFDLTQQFNNKNGAVLVGGKLYVYYVGRTDLATTWADEDASATNTNPVLLDNNGRAPVFVDDSYAYTLVVCDRNGAELFSQDITPGGAGSVGGRIVYHDETLSGAGTISSLLGVVNIPLGVDDTMTAYTGVAEGRDALILGVNGDWFSANFLSGLNNKVDWSAFNSAYYGLKGDISSKADWSALNNYFTKNETTYMLSDYIKTSAMTNILQNYYTIPQTDALLDKKQDNLTFEYNDSSAISSINGSALAGQGGDSCPWISGTKVIADTQTLTSNMIIQILSSFDLSGYKNHNIGMKGGTYRFPNEYEIGSALLHTNYFMHLSGMSGYLPNSSFSSYTTYADNRMTSIHNLANSAYTTAVNNLYNKVDWSAFSSYSAGQESIINDLTNQITNISGDLSSYATKTYVDSKDPVLIGDSNVTATSSKVDNHTQWNLAVNGTPVVTDTKLVGDNCVTAHTTETSGEWIVGLVQSAYEAIDSIDGISSDVDTLKNSSGNYYPMTGNPSGFINDLSNYYQKNETSSKEQISDAIASIPQGDPDVNSFVQTNSSTILDVDNVVQVNSAQWAENTGDTQVNNYVYNNSGINNEVNNVVTANSGVWNNVTNKLETTAFTAWSSTIFSGDYELSAGEGISITDDVQNRKTIISNNLSAGSNISLVYDVETNKIRIDGEGGTTYTGDAQGALDKVYANSGNWISTTNNEASALFFAKKVTSGNQTIWGPILSSTFTTGNTAVNFGIRGNSLIFAWDDNYSHDSAFYTLTSISSYGTSNAWNVGNWDWHLDYRGLGGTFSDLNENTATWSALRNVDLGLTTGGVVSSISGHEIGAGKTYTGVAPIQVNNSTNEISITGESLSAGPGIDLFESGGYVVISANGGVGAGGTSAYYTTGGTSIFEDTMNINSDGVVTLGSYTPGQLVPTTNLTSDEGKFPMIYCRDGRSYYLLERVRQLPYYNAQTNGVLGMSAGSPNWVPMPNCYCVKLNNVTTSVDLANYTAYDKVTVVHSQEGGNDCHLYWDGKTKVIHSASYCELVKVTDGNNNIKWTFTTSGWTNDNWWDWD